MSEGTWLTRPNSALIAIDTNVITFVKLDTFSETFETKHCYQKTNQVYENKLCKGGKTWFLINY